MANDSFVMSARQAAELDHAFERSGWNAGDVKWLSSGNNLAEILRIRRGEVKAVPIPPEDFFRETGELSIAIPALPRPTLEELQSKYNWIKSIERDSSPTDAITLKLATVLRENENLINGSKYEERIAPKLEIILGYQQAAWLVERQDEFPEFTALLGKVYIDFTGLVVVDGDGDRRCPYLDQSGERWYLYWSWVGDDFYRSGRLAFSSKYQFGSL